MKLTKQKILPGMTKEVLDLAKVALYFSRGLEKIQYMGRVEICREMSAKDDRVEVKIYPGNGYNGVFTVRSFHAEVIVKQILKQIIKELTNKTPEYYGGEK